MALLFGVLLLGWACQSTKAERYRRDRVSMASGVNDKSVANLKPAGEDDASFRRTSTRTGASSLLSQDLPLLKPFGVAAAARASRGMSPSALQAFLDTGPPDGTFAMPASGDAPDIDQEPAVFAGDKGRGEMTLPRMGRFTLESYSGSGYTGDVYKARLKGTDTVFAVKVIDMDSGHKVSALARELPALRRFDCDDIVSMVDVKLAWKPPKPGETGRGCPVVLLFMEAADASLESVIDKSYQQVPMQTRIRMMVEILRGLDAVASGGLVHRDIKPQNIFVFGDCETEDCHVKLGDFGFACDIARSKREELQEVLGSPMYIAPEVWRGDGATPKSDLWSVGMVLYELFTGSSPLPLHSEEFQRSYDSLEMHPLREFIAANFRLKDDDGWRRFRLRDPEVADFIASLLRKRSYLRPTVRRALRKARALAEARGINLRLPGKSSPRLPLAPAT
mmetsp:Transcript_6978/g.19753  ORF Transcript_6978/g.19753 Transcript_6978/m.19753 type:complete len:450 (+) Transcript_6978:95-1444(+)